MALANFVGFDKCVAKKKGSTTDRIVECCNFVAGLEAAKVGDYVVKTILRRFLIFFVTPSHFCK